MLEKRKIIIADTIGFCDTVWSDDSIFNLIKDRIHSNLNKLNYVIFVISSTSRMQKNFNENIKKIMSLLIYDKNFNHFYFVFIHCEYQNEEKKEELKRELLEILNLKEIKYPIFIIINKIILKSTLRLCWF